ncbi:MAG: NTP transferase domain-containing protein [Candidatus Falkowbacteria bacterium]
MNGRIIILAGGKGVRMNSTGAKVLQPILGLPMIEYVFKSFAELDLAERPVVVVGFDAANVKKQINPPPRGYGAASRRVMFVGQKEQLGTGHAVACCKRKFKNYAGPILVLYGDHPLISRQTIENLFKIHEKAGAQITMMTTSVEDFNDWRQGFFAFGRILRDTENNICAIRELRDCDENERKILELNPGYYCFDSQWLWKNIGALKNNNNQKEYYLTDLIELAVEQGIKINSLKIHPIECVGVNTPEQLAIVERLLKK